MMAEQVIVEAEEKVWAKEELRIQFVSHKVINLCIYCQT